MYALTVFKSIEESYDQTKEKNPEKSGTWKYILDVLPARAYLIGQVSPAGLTVLAPSPLPEPKPHLPSSPADLFIRPQSNFYPTILSTERQQRTLRSHSVNFTLYFILFLQTLLVTFFSENYTMAAVAPRKCIGLDCANDAGTLQCPTCLKMGTDSFFCSQDCFKRSWVCACSSCDRIFISLYPELTLAGLPQDSPQNQE